MLYSRKRNKEPSFCVVMNYCIAINMYRKYFYASVTLAFLIHFSLSAQESDGYFNNSSAASVYNYNEAFNTSFYLKNGTEYRSASGKPGIAYWQNQADYQINVKLDDVKNEISGTEVITYTNNSPDELEFLWLQLDQNLFRQDSRGARIIPMAGSRSGTKGQDFDAGFNIKSVSVADGENAVVKYAIEDTRMQVFLPGTLKPKGGKVQIKINYSFIVPMYGSDRTGIFETKNGKIFAVAQWYPRMCVYDDIVGWNTAPYTGLSEFYLEYGTFDVNITAPANHIVVCSGELLNPSEVYTASQQKLWDEAKRSDRTVVIRSSKDVADPKSRPSGRKELTWHFRIENSRDIAWASSPAFIVDAARINLPEGRSSLAVSAYPIESNHKSGWQRSTEFTKASVEHYSAKWMPYPYPAAVNVAADLNGMEYPGIVFCTWKERGAALWDVTDHEFGHTWFPMIVGSNERLHSWMDEGLNTFINYLSTDTFNKGEFKPGQKDMHKWARILADQSLEPVTAGPDNIKEQNSTILVYVKPALGLWLLRDQILGEERFDRAFKAYIDRWAFKHPEPYDFFRTIENVAGEDLSWFWRSWFLNNWKMDQAISGVSYYKNDPSKGALITIANLQKMPMPAIVEVKTKSGSTSRIKLPVEIWKRDISWTFLYPSTEEISTVTLDPDHVLPDCNTGNNSWKVRQ